MVDFVLKFLRKFTKVNFVLLANRSKCVSEDSKKMKRNIAKFFFAENIKKKI